MLGQAADLPEVEPIAVTPRGDLGAIAPALTNPVSLLKSWITFDPSDPRSTKAALRTSLWASTLDGVFATIFTNIAGGVLLSNFLVDLQASPMQIGFLSSIPMLANLIQPLGAYLSNRTTSRHWYGLLIYGPSRLLWLILVMGILWVNWHHTDPHQLILGTLVLVVATHFLGALGSASWLSWLAVLVPRRLRGRYFGIRNSAASLTSLLSIPLLGLAVSKFPGGTIQGYGVLLLVGVVMGLLSLLFQCWMIDVNPQDQRSQPLRGPQQVSVLEQSNPETTAPDWFRDRNFLVFLLHFALWMFAVNVSAPFFNVYLLDNLSLDVSWVALYASLSAGANLLLLMVWGRLADRFGNRPILILVGLLVAVTPLLWLGITQVTPLVVWLWLPLLHLLGGGTWAAMDLCNNNLQLEIATPQHQATYFAIVAAVAGVSGALGTTAGGLLDQFAQYSGLPGVFALSSVLRLLALIPLVFVVERRSQPIRRVLRSLLPQQAS